MNGLEDVHLAAMKLMRKDKFDEAADLLRSHRDAARDRGDNKEAAVFGSFLGSCLMGAGRDGRALEAYLTAEDDNPDDPFLKIQTASHLQRCLHRGEEALPKL